MRGVGHRLTIPEGDRDRASGQAPAALLSGAAVDEEQQQGMSRSRIIGSSNGPREARTIAPRNWLFGVEGEALAEAGIGGGVCGRHRRPPCRERSGNVTTSRHRAVGTPRGSVPLLFGQVDRLFEELGCLGAAQSDDFGEGKRIAGGYIQ